jgi:hypothetical protein
MRRALISFLAALAILTAAVPGLAAGDGSRRQLAPEEVAAQVKKAQEKGQRVTVRFRNGTRVNGTVDEVREHDFIIIPYNFASRLSLKEQDTAVEIFYEQVASVERESKAKRFFRKAGEGFAFGGVVVGLMPVVVVGAALGKVPGCPPPRHYPESQ